MMTYAHDQTSEHVVTAYFRLSKMPEELFGVLVQVLCTMYSLGVHLPMKSQSRQPIILHDITDIFIMFHQQTEAGTVIDFDPTKMSMPSHDTLDKVSLECGSSQCTADESDESSQAGNNFAHLKHVERPGSRPILRRVTSQEEFICTKLKSWKSLPVPDMEKVRQVSDLSVMCEAEAKPIRRTKSCVSFNEVNMRFYDQCVGDHPATSYGPPISLDWNYEEAEPINIDEYENQRGARRTLRQMMVNYYARKNTLMWVYGASEDELKKATKASGRVAFQRGVTKYLLPVSKVEEILSSVARKTKRVVTGQKKRSTTV